MYATVTNYVRGLTSGQYSVLCNMFCAANNLYNVGLYYARQTFFAQHVFPSYNATEKECKKNENYGLLPAQGAQQVLLEVSEAIKGYLALTKLEKEKKYDPKKVRLPGYKKKGGMSGFSYPAQKLSIKDGKMKVPISQSVLKKHKEDKEDYDIRIPFPKTLEDKELQEIRLYPVGNAKAIKVAYVYKEISNPDTTLSGDVMGIDLGLDNFASCVTTTGTSFLLDGRGMKLG